MYHTSLTTHVLRCLADDGKIGLLLDTITWRGSSLLCSENLSSYHQYSLKLESLPCRDACAWLTSVLLVQFGKFHRIAQPGYNCVCCLLGR
jgi:hypothetical protein